MAAMFHLIINESKLEEFHDGRFLMLVVMMKRMMMTTTTVVAMMIMMATEIAFYNFFPSLVLVTT